MNQYAELIYQTHPDVIIAGNTFRNVPVILQFENTPLLEVGRFAEAGYTTRFPVFHSDGTKIAVVNGCRIFLTEEGRKAQLSVKDKHNVYVCELEGKPILEMRRHGPAALKGWAALYATEGVLIRVNDAGASGLLKGGEALQIGGLKMQGTTFDGCKIGIKLEKNGVALGLGGGSISMAHLSMGNG